MNKPCTSSSVFVHVNSVCMLFFTVTFMFLIMLAVNYLVYASYPLTLDLNSYSGSDFHIQGPHRFLPPVFIISPRRSFSSTIYAE